MGYAPWRAPPLASPEVQTVQFNYALIFQLSVAANSSASRKELISTALGQCFDVHQAFSGEKVGYEKEARRGI